MKTFEEYCIDERFADRFRKKETYAPRDKKELMDTMKKLIRERGWDGDFNDVDVSQVTDMKYLFCGPEMAQFRGDISRWDVSNVTDMESMFEECYFNGDISGWDVSNVKTMEGMFMNSFMFNQDISMWDMSNVENISNMFLGAKRFNRDLRKWNLKSAKEYGRAFEDCPIKEQYRPEFNK